VLPAVFGFGSMLFLAAGKVDPLVYSTEAGDMPPVPRQVMSRGRAFFASVDYAFGLFPEADAYIGVPDNYVVATCIHVLAMIVLSLIFTNLLIAIVGDTWEVTKQDSMCWLAYGESALATAVEGARMQRRVCRRGHVEKGEVPAQIAVVRPDVKQDDDGVMARADQATLMQHRLTKLEEMFEAGIGDVRQETAALGDKMDDMLAALAKLQRRLESSAQP
jgi:hypothetical protein